jgi:hypothetical protein
MIILFFIGGMAHFGPMLAQTASGDITDKFHKEHLLPIFSGLQTFFSIFVKFFNTKYLIKIAHMKRYFAAMMLLSIQIGCTFSGLRFEIFELCLMGTIMLGIGKAFSDTVVSGFIKGLPPSVFGGFAMGQGFGGIFGTFVYFIMKHFKFEPQSAFIVMIPIYVMQYSLFIVLVRVKVKLDNLKNIDKSVKATAEDEAKINKKLDLITLKRSFVVAWHYFLTIFFMYYIPMQVFSNF